MIAQSTYLTVGPPGCGKTTYLSTKVRELTDEGQSVLICSLTKSAAAEVTGRDLPIPPEAIGTVHSHAYRALGSPEIAETQLRDWNHAEPGYDFDESAVDPDDPFDHGARSDTSGQALRQQYELLRARMVARACWPPAVLDFATRWEAWKGERDLVDFTDMIEQARRQASAAPGDPDVILVDECQDLSKLELALLRRWARSARSLFLVGDPWQSLYTWRGAYPEMFDSRKVKPQRRSVLARSYRVPRAVHRAALRWVGNLSTHSAIAYHPKDEDGEAQELHGVHIRYPDPLIPLIQGHLNENRSVMICASCAYMLRRVQAVLRDCAMPFCNPWRRGRDEWNPLGRRRGVSIVERILAFMRPNGGVFGSGERSELHGDPIGVSDGVRTWPVRELLDWMAVVQEQGLLRSGAKSQITSLAATGSRCSPRMVTLDDVGTWFTKDAGLTIAGMLKGRVSTQEALCWFEKRLLSCWAARAAFPLAVTRRRGLTALQEQPRLYVGTIHSFKGGEADVVVIFPDLSPSGMHEWLSDGEGKDSIVRMFYVALTRARQAVYVCDPASSRSVDVGACVTP